jgi:hypothetical protein
MVTFLDLATGSGIHRADSEGTRLLRCAPDLRKQAVAVLNVSHLSLLEHAEQLDHSTGTTWPSLLSRSISSRRRVMCS